MSFCQSLLIRFLVQSTLVCASVRYEQARHIADVFSLVTAILTFDPSGHILGVVAEELAEDAIFMSGAAVFPIVGLGRRGAALEHRIQAARLALRLNLLQPGLTDMAPGLNRNQNAIAVDFRLVGT